MKRSIRLDHWILLATIPTLVVVTLILGVVVYESLYNRILTGFDRKLLAAVGVTSAFIDGDDHATLLEPVPVRALEWDGAVGRLLGVDATGRVLMIDDATGEADPMPGAELEPALDLALAGNRLFYLTEDGRVMERAWPLTPGERPTLRGVTAREEEARGLAWSEGRLLAAGKRLLEIPLVDKVSPPREVGGLTGAAPLVSMTVAGPELLVLRSDAATSGITRVGVDRSFAVGVSTPVRDEAGSRGASGLATDGERVFVATPAGLVRYAKLPAGETGDSAGTALGWRSRRDPIYVRYVDSMRAVLTKLGFAYCYSQILREDNGIAYVLDATDGPDQAVVGGADTIPAEDWQAARRVVETGTVLVGRIKKFDRWGLLKVATGPVKDRSGRISATTGVDVNITTIQGKSRVVLLEVFFLGSVALVFAIALSVGLARRLTRPLSLIKGAALRVAAGQTGQAVSVQRPVELFNLARTFNEVSERTREHLEGLDRQWHELEADRHARLLAKRLLTPPRVAGVEEVRQNSKSGAVNESGQAHLDGRTIIFLVDRAGVDPTASLTLAARRDLARRLLAATRELDPTEALERFRGLVPGQLALVDAHAGVIVRSEVGGSTTEPFGEGPAVFESETAEGASFVVSVKPVSTPAGEKS